MDKETAVKIYRSRFLQIGIYSLAARNRGRWGHTALKIISIALLTFSIASFMHDWFVAPMAISGALLVLTIWVMAIDHAIIRIGIYRVMRELERRKVEMTWTQFYDLVHSA
jgi:hypothetical protein